MYKQLIAVHFTSALFVLAAGNTWPERISSAAELDRHGKFSEAGAMYSEIVDEARSLPQADARRSEAFNNAGSHAFYIGDYRNAESLFIAALEAYNAAGESNDAKLASILGNSAAVYRIQARYPEAEQAARRATAASPAAPTLWANLAEIYRVQGKLDGAENAARKSLDLLPAAERDSRIHVLAAVLRDRRQYDEALKLYERAVKYQEARHSITSATSLSNIAELYLRQSDLANAESAANRALEIWRAAGITATPNVAATLNNLAQVRKLQGRFAEAEPIYRRALAVWETCVGKDHPEYAKGLSNLADFYHAIGNDRAAEGLYRRAAAILSATVGTESAAELNARRIEILNSMGRHTDATRLGASLR
jgi:tetratricopeptide (TPR) repeat protein